LLKNMEIFENLGINWRILLGQIINFLLVLYLLKRFVYRWFLNLLKERKEKIEKGIKMSEEAERRSEAVNVEREEILSRSREEGLKVLKKNEELAEKRKEEILAQTQKERELLLRKSQEEGKSEIERMKKEQSEKMLNLSFALVEKILEEKIDLKKDKEIIEKLLREIK